MSYFYKKNKIQSLAIAIILFSCIALFFITNFFTKVFGSYTIIIALALVISGFILLTEIFKINNIYVINYRTKLLISVNFIIIAISIILLFKIV